MSESDEARTVFVFLLACGCPAGLVEGSAAQGSKDKAWDIIFGGDLAEERRMRDAGTTVEHMPLAEYKQRYYHLMTAACPHAGVAK